MCKINPDKYSPSVIKKFREYYPKGRNYCFCPHIHVPYKFSFNGIEVNFQTVP